MPAAAQESNKVAHDGTIHRLQSLPPWIHQAPGLCLCALLNLCVHADTLVQHTPGGQRSASGVSSHFPPCLGQYLPLLPLQQARQAGMQSGDSPVSASGFAVGTLGV